MSFSQALSGLNAQSENLKILGNNIANSQTVGFKSSGAIFADVFAGANSQVGLGVKVSNVLQDFTAGDLETTGRTLDLAVAGEGFYRVQQINGEVAYTRNGQFSQDNQGFLVNAAGQRLTGYGLSDQNDPFSEVIAGGAPQALRIPVNDIPASSTTQANATYNLNANESPGEQLQTATLIDAANDPVEVDYHFSNSFTTYDSLGNERNVSVYFEKVGDNTWANKVAVDGRVEGSTNDFRMAFDENGALELIFAKSNAIDVSGLDLTNVTATNLTNFMAPTTTPPTLEDLATALEQADQIESVTVDGDNITVTYVEGTPDGFTFDLTDGVSTQTFAVASAERAVGQGDNLAVDIAVNAQFLAGAADLKFNFNLNGTTQFNNNSVQNTLTQDGYTSGSLAGLEITREGRVIRIFTNEERRDAGQIVLANFANEEGLQPIGDNAWRETNNSGVGVIGTAGTGVFGTIESGVLEGSNVDLAKQLVDTIVAQRAYQANSTSISTQDELLQTIINL